MGAPWLAVRTASGDRVEHEDASWSEVDGALVVTAPAGGRTYPAGEWFSVEESDQSAAQWAADVEQAQADEAARLEAEAAAAAAERAAVVERDSQQQAAAAAQERALAAQAALERAQAEAQRLAREADEAAAQVPTGS